MRNVSSESTEYELRDRVERLSRLIWEGRCKGPDLDEWLANFNAGEVTDAATERLQALHLLASTCYFGRREIEVLLVSVYRQLYRYPIVQRIRRDAPNGSDVSQILAAYQDRLSQTRFVPLGEVSESGSWLAYPFRKVNSLSKTQIVVADQLFGPLDGGGETLDPPNLGTVVFLDDLCGSGVQAIEYGAPVVRRLREAAGARGISLEILYLPLIGCVDGLDEVRSQAGFDRVDAVLELDETYKTFAPTAWAFRKPREGIDQDLCRRIALHYGSKLDARWPLGYRDNELTLAFSNNTPDNTIPILWYAEDPQQWRPAFPRSPKIV